MSKNKDNTLEPNLIIMGLEIPITPNFIRLSIDKEKTLPIERLTDKQLKIIGEAWTSKLIESAREKRKNNTK